MATLLLQVRALGLGLLQDGDIGIGVFPEREEILICSLGFDGVSGDGICAGELQVGERAEQEVNHDSGMVGELLELGGGSSTIFLREIRQAAKVRGINWAAEV